MGTCQKITILEHLLGTCTIFTILGQILSISHIRPFLVEHILRPYHAHL